ncbi:MAG: hypothetical protein VB080_07510 [Propionicimonas sp.]|nr:hypothetical protein [Propionicimonas sp.]MEA4944269.1 hypothetical protein [Propionicimonas sp.]MEA5054015.1 hypothetical protein [Propionicimonas sp.]MEA5116657.1 hypothetical protein [Propionicimonas sp.]
MGQGDWYWCLDHHLVEPYEGCRSRSRLGPYPSADAAAHALERVEERNLEWENDPRFNDPDEDDDEPDSSPRTGSS